MYIVSIRHIKTLLCFFHYKGLLRFGPEAGDDVVIGQGLNPAIAILEIESPENEKFQRLQVTGR